MHPFANGILTMYAGNYVVSTSILQKSSAFVNLPLLLSSLLWHQKKNSFLSSFPFLIYLFCLLFHSYSSLNLLNFSQIFTTPFTYTSLHSTPLLLTILHYTLISFPLLFSLLATYPIFISIFHWSSLLSVTLLQSALSSSHFFLLVFLLCSTLRYSPLLSSFILYSPKLCFSLLYSTSLYSTSLYLTLLYSVLLYSTLL